jgi:uncharacterized protein
MNRRDAIDILKKLREQLEARGVAHVGIFGSVAREQATTASDVDIVVTPSAGKHMDLIDLGGIQAILDESFGGCDVDVVVEPVRKADLQSSIERDRVAAF